jgi:hypothetical protein
MRLRDFIKLLKKCNYMVLDLDSGLRTDYIPSWERGNPQLRTLLDKVVKAVCPAVVPEGALGSLVVEVSDEKL